LQELKAAAGNVQSIKSTFVQEKHLKILQKPLLSKGVLFYQSPGSLRWEYKTPVHSVLFLHDGKTKQFVMGEKGLTETTGSGQEFMQIGLQEIARWLGGNFDENPFFSVRLVPGEKIILTAKEDSISRFVPKIELHLSDQPGVLESVWIYESKDSYTKLCFNNTIINKKLDASLFTEIK